MSKYNMYALRLDRSFRAARAEYQRQQAEGKPGEAAQVWPRFERERDRLTAELEQNIKRDAMKNWNELIRISDFCTGQTQDMPKAAIAAGNWWEKLTAAAIENF